MRSSIEVYNDIASMKAEQRRLSAQKPSASRDQALFRLDGKIEQADQELKQAIAEEDRARGTFSRGTIVSRADIADSIAAQVLGPRSEFKGLVPGFRAAVTVPAGPTVPDPTVPGFPDLPRGFADTLPQATTTGSVNYLRRGAKTNAAAQWDGVSAKPESSYEWTEELAALAYIAHHVPIAKAQASDYGQLEATIRGEMLLGLAQAKSREALVGANPSGIVGVLNTLGIIEHTIDTGDNVYDAIRRMVTKVYVTSGFRPTAVAMAPQVREALDLLKSSVDEHYLAVNVGDEVWRLEVVEDLALAVVDELEAVHYGMVVYAPAGATWFTKEQDAIEIGLVNDQFVKNAYTLLAEGRHALAVRFPDAFCYCADAITVAE